MDCQPEKHIDWPELVAQLNAEFAALSAAERDWLTSRVCAIAEIQRALDTLFRAAGGLQACADCDGECCGCGRHHLTLINIVGFLSEGQSPPVPAFDRTCPFLGDSGCLLAVERRPYNCITFFCETLEDQLDESGREQWKALDARLREEYEKVERRYAVGTLRGIWIGLERVADQPLLKCRDTDVVK